MEKTNNSIELRGVLAGRPEYSHSVRGEEYFIFPLAVERLSGVTDVLNIMARRELLEKTELGEGTGIAVKGEVRSFNNRSGTGSRLVITVFAMELTIGDGTDTNRVSLTGTICKTPTFRRTPMGREICDVMLAVNRRYGRSDYLPCIVWGTLAEETEKLGVGTEIRIFGRLQSRRYIKVVDGVQTERVAFEISAASVEVTRDGKEKSACEM